MLAMIHGAGGDHHVWDALCAALPEEKFALDLPGRRAAGPVCASARDAASAVIVEIGARGLRTEDVIVVGHSYGGAVGIECALAAPFGGLVLISTGARLRVHPDVLATMPAHAAGVSAETARTDWLAADAFDRMSDVSRITAPTLVIGGDRDELTPPKYARYLAAQIPGATLALLSDAGHLCIVDDAPRVAAEITNWLHRARP